MNCTTTPADQTEFAPPATPIRHIFLDMDGVLVDFFRPVLQLHDALHRMDDWPPGTWDVHKVLGMSKSDFWRKIDAEGSRFWAEMPAYSWTKPLVEAIEEIAPFTILSSPSLCPECPTGKIYWLRQHLGDSFRDYLFGHAKHHCAKPGALLIDDSDKNVNAFREHGGEAILFPRPWNSHHNIENPLAYVAAELRRYQPATQHGSSRRRLDALARLAAHSQDVPTAQ